MVWLMQTVWIDPHAGGNSARARRPSASGGAGHDTAGDAAVDAALGGDSCSTSSERTPKWTCDRGFSTMPDIATTREDNRVLTIGIGVGRAAASGH